MIDKEFLENELSAQKRNLEQAIAQVNALQGAVQMIEGLIAKCDEDASAEENKE